MFECKDSFLFVIFTAKIICPTGVLIKLKTVHGRARYLSVSNWHKYTLANVDKEETK
jgi:hypothetical protein